MGVFQTGGGFRFGLVRPNLCLRDFTDLFGGWISVLSLFSLFAYEKSLVAFPKRVPAHHPLVRKNGNLPASLPV